MKQWFKNLFNNQYFEVVSIFLTSLVIDTATGNRYITYTLLVISILALLRALLKDLFGIETPYVKYLLKLFKFNRVLEQVDDTDKFYEDMEKNYYQAKDLIQKNKGGFINFMKKFLKLIYANKKTITGFLAAILITVELAFEISTKLKISQEWYLTAIAILFILIELAIFGRGPETIEKFFNIKAEKDKVKAIAKREKALEKANKMRELLGLPPLRKNEKNEYEQPPLTNNQVRPLTKEELEKRNGRTY